MARILVIEDTDDVRTLLLRILEKAGYDVLSVSDGEEGLRVFHRELVDLVITDILLPKKDGVEIIREIKQGFPDVKIIAISGGAQMGLESKDFLKMLSRLGALQTSPKPLPLTKMIEAVQELVSAPS